MIHLVLNDFRSQEITWDKASRKMFDTFEASAGDSNGRKMILQVLDQGKVTNLSGVNLSLAWKKSNGDNKGLDAFKVVDATKGLFEIYYTTQMLSNIGDLKASFILVDSTGRIESDSFTIVVNGSMVDDGSVQSENSFTSLTEALVKVNELEENYAPRLNEVTYQLAQKLSKNATDLSIDMFNENDRNVLQGQQNGTINAVLGDKNVKRVNLANQVVSPDKTNFAKSENLYVGDVMVGGIIGSIGEPSDVTFSGDESAISYITRLDVGKMYTVSKNESNRFRLATSVVFPETGQAISRYLFQKDDATQHTFSLEGDEKYLVAMVSLGGTAPTEFQVEEGIKKTDFDLLNKTVTINFSDKSIPTSALRNENGSDSLIFTKEKDFKLNKADVLLNSVVKPINLFYGSEEKMSIVGDYVGGYFSANNSAISYIVKIEPGNNYTVSKTVSNRFRLATSVKYPENLLEHKRFLYVKDTDLSCSFQAQEGEEYLVVYVSLDGTAPSKFQVELGFTPTAFTDKGYINFNEAKEYSIPDSAIRNSGFIADTPSGNYLSKASDYIDHLQRDINIVYGLYDSLVEKYPEYVTKTLLSIEESGLPIYRYDFTPHTFGGYEHPKVVYSHEHGHETMAVYGGYSFFNEICSNWLTDDILQMFRWNIHFIVIPTLNPWGFNNNIRMNYKGVDLNRNFPSGWTLTEAGSQNYSGSKPLSEIGSQIMYDMIQNEENVLFAIDHHNFGADVLGSEPPFWIGSNNQSVRDAIFTTTNYLSYHLLKNYDIPHSTIFPLVVSPSIQGGLANEWVVNGVKGLILETVFSVKWSATNGQRFTLDVLGNTILSLIRKFT